MYSPCEILLAILLPKCQKAFPKALASLSEEEFYQSINLVKPSLIRIFADEVTYNLHIILRYELEKDLISGALSVDDIPDLWESKMQESLGIKPAHDSEGCLQDIHWSLGYMGYFPSYTLGNLYAGTLFAFLQKTYPDWQQRVASGDFLFIKEFLEEHIHKHGRAYTPVELIEKATKESFSSEPYLRYLEAKYPL
jgi:carboxypeptidase Taq